MNAIEYIVKNHPSSKIQFLDGWTGKELYQKNLKKHVMNLMLNLKIF